VLKLAAKKSGIFHISCDTQYEVTATFMRLQEFYECPSKTIRGKFFTHADFMDDYASRHGNFTYCLDWGGFNVPGHVARDFFRLFNWEKLSKRERELKFILSEALNEYERFYVIGTYATAYIDHELSHAFWYLHENYQRQMLSLIDKLTIQKSMRRTLLRMGYDEQQVPDEIQAYLTTSSPKELEDNFKMRTIGRAAMPFRKEFQKHKKQEF
jgi:hypothetical protein